MNDKAIIYAGLALFVVLATFPIWYAFAGGEGVKTPELKPPEDGSQCVEDATWMRAHHMELLNQWRDDVVRGDGTKQEYQSLAFPRTKPCEKSLERTCFGCHTMETESTTKRSCGQCHEYANVELTCMGCHIEPKTKSKGN